MCPLYEQVCLGEVMPPIAVSQEGKVREKEEPTAPLRELLVEELVDSNRTFQLTKKRKTHK